MNGHDLIRVSNVVLVMVSFSFHPGAAIAAIAGLVMAWKGGEKTTLLLIALTAAPAVVIWFAPLHVVLQVIVTGLVVWTFIKAR